VATWKIRLLMAVVLAFLYSAFQAFGELRYAIWGKTVEAQLLQVRSAQDADVSGHSRAATAFEYSFPDPQLGSRSEKDLVPTTWKTPQGHSVLVQYIPGEKDESRLAGHTQTGSVAFFVGCLVVMVGFIALLVKEANEPVRGRSMGKGSR
jgi:hypothetical protein